MALMADDAVFESTGPGPDGRRVEGRDAIRADWADMFAGTRDASFTFEESFVHGDPLPRAGSTPGRTTTGSLVTSAAWTSSGCATGGSRRSCPT